MGADTTDTEADRLRAGLVRELVDGGHLPDPTWREAFTVVPRHVFVPGFYLRSEKVPNDDLGLPVWDPVTEQLDRERWLRAAYTDQTLITQLDGEEVDWTAPRQRHGGIFTSSSTLPSLVATMWHDAQIEDGHRVLEVGTGTGYSTALACKRLGSTQVTSVEVDGARLARAHQGLAACGYAPHLAEADGVYGYWPQAPYDRVVLACSMRHVPTALIGQTARGGKILVPLSGWMGGCARALLTVGEDGQAEGPLLPGTISFMLARAHTPPQFGNPHHWAWLAAGSPPHPARHPPQHISGADAESFHPEFLAQCAVPDAQRATLDGVVHLVDVRSGSVALIEPDEGGGWHVRQAGPIELWDRVERVLDAYDAAGRPGPGEFRLRVTGAGQYLTHPDMPDLILAEAR